MVEYVRVSQLMPSWYQVGYMLLFFACQLSRYQQEVTATARKTIKTMLFPDGTLRVLQK
jgi:protein-S-isoprenylcysteine O-methyltransferase Ste14